MMIMIADGENFQEEKQHDRCPSSQSGEMTFSLSGVTGKMGGKKH